MAGRRLLLIADDERLARRLEELLEPGAFLLQRVAGSGDLAAALPAAVIVLALEAGRDVDRVLELLPSLGATAPVVVVATAPSVEQAVRVMQAGASDYLALPLARSRLERALERLLRPPAPPPSLESRLLGNSASMRTLRELIERIARARAPLLIQGESGTGKDLVARAVHDRSRRSAEPFVTVDCGALAESVLESELFGHVRGAFSGASEDRRGLFVEADRGSIFLDEIGGISPGFQGKLLRVIEDGEVRPVGSTRSRPTSVRVIAATNLDLRRAVLEGRFRNDLYYRLNVVSLVLPPLRERGEDIELLARHFAARAAGELQRPAPRLEAGFLGALRRYAWPGNVRELQNVMERVVLLGESSVLRAQDVPAEIRRAPPPLTRSGLKPYREAKREMHRRFVEDYVARLLAEASGNISQAAAKARIPRQTLHRLLRSLRPKRRQG